MSLLGDLWRSAREGGEVSKAGEEGGESKVAGASVKGSAGNKVAISTVDEQSVQKMSYVQGVSSSSFGKVKVSSLSNRSGVVVGKKHGPLKMTGSKRPCSPQ